MTPLLLTAILISGVSFITYGVLLLTSSSMKNEFKRFGLEQFSTLTGVLEILGGIGMLVGLGVDAILLLSSGGLALLMLLGFIVRLKVHDGFWLTLPSFFFLVLNLYVFFLVL